VPVSISSLLFDFNYTATCTLYVKIMFNYATDASFTYRMLQVIRDEDGQPHIVEADSSIPVNTALVLCLLGSALAVVN